MGVPRFCPESMNLELTPTTELEAVNVLLGAIGEAPISDLEALGNLYASQARDTLRAVSREVKPLAGGSTPASRSPSRSTRKARCYRRSRSSSSPHAEASRW
jgi:hypothetical protein